MLFFYVVIFLMVGMQLGVVWAKREHPRRFAQVTLAGLWTVPLYLALQSGYWRFPLVWLVWSFVTGLALKLASQRPLAPTTPRLVYRWFLLSHRITAPIATIGVSLVVGDFLGLGVLEAMVVSPEVQLLLFFYGMYFGILTRDCAELTTDLMSSGRIGRGEGRLGFSSNRCGICGGGMAGGLGAARLGEGLGGGDNPYGSSAQGGLGGLTGQGGVSEGVITLSCSHVFHDQCIRGWTMVGKRDECPTCLEKVEMSHLIADRPWEKVNQVWGQLLDMFRYMVVWFPVLLMATHLLFYEVGLLPPNPHERR